jgi:hypothetical protein
MLGVVGAGGVLYGPGGKTKVTFSWSLGLSSNNQEEAYTLFRCLVINKDQGIHTLIILGYSKNTIRHLHLNIMVLKLEELGINGFILSTI